MSMLHENRYCEVCGTSLAGKRKDATTCSDNCRTIKSQRKKSEATTDFAPTAEEQEPLEVEAEEIGNFGHAKPTPEAQGVCASDFSFPAQKLLEEIEQTKQSISEQQKLVNGLLADTADSEAKRTSLLHQYNAVSLQIKQKAKQEKIERQKEAEERAYQQAKSSFDLDSLFRRIGEKPNSLVPVVPAMSLEEQLLFLKNECLGYKVRVNTLKPCLKIAKEHLDSLKKRQEKLERVMFRTIKARDFESQKTKPNASFKGFDFAPDTPDDLPKETYQPSPHNHTHTGAQVRAMKLAPTIKLPNNFNSLLGDLERDKCFIALTGDAGAGKTTFSFFVARLFDSIGLKVKYFSLEVGFSNQVKLMVKQARLSERFVITDKATHQDLEKASQDFDVVIVDSFGKIYDSAKPVDELRNKYPQTIFMGIFQKTTAGTMRGGSAVIYDSSATWDIVRDNETQKRTIHIVTSRYGNMGKKEDLDNLFT